MADLQPLKAYGWLLSEVEMEEARRWIGAIPNFLCTGGGQHKPIGDMGPSDGAIATAEAGRLASAGADSSSSAQPQTKKAKQQEARTADAQSNMLRFFGAAGAK